MCIPTACLTIRRARNLRVVADALLAYPYPRRLEDYDDGWFRS